MIVASLEKFMNHENVDSRRMDLHRRIALILRKEPGLVRDLAEHSYLRQSKPNKPSTPPAAGYAHHADSSPD
jgi:hypothetical protein